MDPLTAAAFEGPLRVDVPPPGETVDLCGNSPSIALSSEGRRTRSGVPAIAALRAPAPRHQHRSEASGGYDFLRPHRVFGFREYFRALFPAEGEPELVARRGG